MTTNIYLLLNKLIIEYLNIPSPKGHTKEIKMVQVLKDLAEETIQTHEIDTRTVNKKLLCTTIRE